jgi:hypothetical protein
MRADQTPQSAAGSDGYSKLQAAPSGIGAGANVAAALKGAAVSVSTAALVI